MRLNLAVLFGGMFLITLPADAAPRPALSGGMLFSAEQIADLDPENGSAEDAIVYGSASSLAEQYSVLGLTYTDNTLHKDWTITTAEARTLLVSVYESLAGRANAAIDSVLQETAKSKSTAVRAKGVAAFQKATDPIAACRILLGTEFVVPPGKQKPKPLAANAPVTWEQAAACFPGASIAPVALMSYDSKTVARNKAMTRGEFIHKLNVAADTAVMNFSNAIY